MKFFEFIQKYQKGLIYGALVGFFLYFLIAYLGPVNETMFYAGGIHYLLLWMSPLNFPNNYRLARLITLICLLAFYTTLGLIINMISYKNRIIAKAIIIILLILYALTIKSCHTMMNSDW